MVTMSVFLRMVRLELAKLSPWYLTACGCPSPFLLLFGIMSTFVSQNLHCIKPVCILSRWVICLWGLFAKWNSWWHVPQLLQEGNKDQPGVVPRTLQRLFDEAYVDTSVSYTFSLSMLEVYKGSLRDLLVCQQPARCTDPASKWYQIFFSPLQRCPNDSGFKIAFSGILG